MSIGHGSSVDRDKSDLTPRPRAPKQDQPILTLILKGFSLKWFNTVLRLVYRYFSYNVAKGKGVCNLKKCPQTDVHCTMYVHRTAYSGTRTHGSQISSFYILVITVIMFCFFSMVPKLLLQDMPKFILANTPEQCQARTAMAARTCSICQWPHVPMVE